MANTIACDTSNDISQSCAANPDPQAKWLLLSFIPEAEHHHRDWLDGRFEDSEEKSGGCEASKAVARCMTCESNAPEDHLLVVSGDQSAKTRDNNVQKHLETWPVGTSVGESRLAIPRTCTQGRRSLPAKRSPDRKDWLPRAKEGYERLYPRPHTNLRHLRFQRLRRMIGLFYRLTAMHR